MEKKKGDYGKVRSVKRVHNLCALFYFLFVLTYNTCPSIRQPLHNHRGRWQEIE